MTEGADLFHVQFLEEDARGFAVLIDQVIRGVQYRLSGAGVLVFRGDYYESPRSQMLQQVVVLTRLCFGPVAQCEDRMRGSARSQIGRLVDIKFVSHRIAT